MRSLQIREERLGSDHPDVVESLETLAKVLGAQGRQQKVAKLTRRAEEIWE